MDNTLAFQAGIVGSSPTVYFVIIYNYYHSINSGIAFWSYRGETSPRRKEMSA